MKKTLVLGASPKPYRYAFIAGQRLTNHGHEVVAVGRREGEMGDIPILTGQPDLENIDTITLYLSPKNQKGYYDYILNLNPKRIIFNPGTENMELMRLAEEKGIEVEPACTLVMLSVGTY